MKKFRLSFRYSHAPGQAVHRARGDGRLTRQHRVPFPMRPRVPAVRLARAAQNAVPPRMSVRRVPLHRCLPNLCAKDFCRRYRPDADVRIALNRHFHTTPAFVSAAIKTPLTAKWHRRCLCPQRQ